MNKTMTNPIKAPTTSQENNKVIVVGESYKDTITGKILKVVDDTNEPPLSKYWCEEVGGDFSCFRKSECLEPLTQTTPQ